MRYLVILPFAIVLSGCGTLGSLGKKSDAPKPIHPIEQSKVDDSFRGVMHSNDPANDNY